MKKLSIILDIKEKIADSISNYRNQFNTNHKFSFEEILTLFMIALIILFLVYLEYFKSSVSIQYISTKKDYITKNIANSGCKEIDEPIKKALQDFFSIEKILPFATNHEGITMPIDKLPLKHFKPKYLLKNNEGIILKKIKIERNKPFKLYLFEEDKPIKDEIMKMEIENKEIAIISNGLIIGTKPGKSKLLINVIFMQTCMVQISCDVIVK